MKAWRKHAGKLVTLCLFLLYLSQYLMTTKVRPQGNGGLSGPLKVRVFKSEDHLLMFYPLYLAERWVRNRSFVYAQRFFNLSFEDGQYRRTYLYGDGEYSRIWYDVF